jgi:hypothetical protein
MANETVLESQGAALVSEKDETVAGDDHDFKCDKVVASVILCLNIAKDVEKSQNILVGLREMEQLLWHCMTQHLSDQMFSPIIHVSLMTWSC